MIPGSTVPNARGPVTSSQFGWGWALLVAWTVSRFTMGCIYDALASFIHNDVNYYAASVSESSIPIFGTIQDILVEYPTPQVWILQVFGALAGSSIHLFQIIFAFFIILLDACVTVALYRRVGVRSAAIWIAAGAGLGPLVWFRLDIFPAVCVLLGLYWARRRPALAGAVIALGAALKLWPALLIIPMLGTRGAARRRGLGFVVTGVVLGGLSLITQGWTRSASPLSWQSDRGLQIESVWATVPMVQRLFQTDQHLMVQFSDYKAYEVFGAAPLWRWIGENSIVVTIALALALFWLIGLGGIGVPGHHLPHRDEVEDPRVHLSLIYACFAVICAVMVTNKTLSPQYLVWLFGPLCLLSLDQPSRFPARSRIMEALGLGVIVLTQLIYPLSYSGLITSPPNMGSTLLLAQRNLLLLLLSIISAVWAVHIGRKTGVDQVEF